MKDDVPLQIRDALEAEGLREFGLVGRRELSAYIAALDPALVVSYGLSLARACVAVAFPWADAAENPPDGNEPYARVGSFAAINRYGILIRKLASAAARLAEGYRGHPGASSPKHWRVAVNSRLPERPLAVLAGLGDIGKSGLLISEAYGSACILGALFIPESVPDGEFGPEGASSARATSHACLSCRVCVDACPSGAIRPEARMNPESCIQYWASREGIVPEAVAAAWDDTLYGCDICSGVCPCTKDTCDLRRAFETDLCTEKNRPGHFIAIRELIDRGDEGIRARFAGTAMGLRWMKPVMWRRNALLALGAWKRAHPREAEKEVQRFRAALERLARDGEPGEAAAAARVLAADSGI